MSSNLESKEQQGIGHFKIFEMRFDHVYYSSFDGKQRNFFGGGGAGSNDGVIAPHSKKKRGENTYPKR